MIHPLVQLLSYAFVFQVCLKVALPPGEVTDNYTAFLFCGFLPWMLFQETVTRSANSLIDNSNLITKTVFPSEIIPVSIFLSSLVSHILALVIVAGFVGIWAGGISPMIAILPVYMLLLGMFAIGIGWIVCSLQVYLRDTAPGFNRRPYSLVLDHPGLHLRKANTRQAPLPNPLEPTFLRRPSLPGAAPVLQPTGAE